MALGALAFAAYLFATGASLAALKVLLVLFFVPSLTVFVVAGAHTVAQPTWYRRVGDVAGLMFLWGCVLVLLPILLYLPWSPARFALGEMPFPLPLIFWVGAPLATIGAIAGMAWGSVMGWREGDRVRAVGGLLFLTLFIIVVAGYLAGR